MARPAKKKAMKKTARLAKQKAPAVQGRRRGRPAKSGLAAVASPPPRPGPRTALKATSLGRREGSRAKSAERGAGGEKGPASLTNLSTNYDQAAALEPPLLAKWRQESQRHGEGVARQLAAIQKMTGDVAERVNAHADALEALDAKIDRVDGGLRAFAERMGAATEDIQHSLEQLRQQLEAMPKSPLPVAAKIRKAAALASPKSALRQQSEPPKPRGRRGRKSHSELEARAEGEHPNVYSSERGAEAQGEGPAPAKKAEAGRATAEEGRGAEAAKTPLVFLAPKATPCKALHGGEEVKGAVREGPLGGPRLSEAHGDRRPPTDAVALAAAPTANERDRADASVARIAAHPLLPSVPAHGADSAARDEHSLNIVAEKRDFF